MTKCDQCRIDLTNSNIAGYFVNDLSQLKYDEIVKKPICKKCMHLNKLLNEVKKIERRDDL